MLFGKSLRLAVSNWKVLLKQLICQLIAFALFLALGFFLLGSLTKDILSSVMANKAIEEILAHTIQSIGEGTFDVDHFLNHDISTLVQSIKSTIEAVDLWGRFEFAVIICIIAFLVYRVIISFTDVAVDCQLNEFMDSNAERPFSWFLFKKTGKSFVFVLMQLLLAILFDTLIIFGCVALGSVFMYVFGWWVIIPVALLGVVLYALRLSFMAYCLPSVVYQDQKPTLEAFRDGLAHVFKSFGKVFAHTIIIVVIMVVTSAIAYLFNENRWISTAISAVLNFILFFIIKCVNLVLYYESNNYPYFYKSMVVEGTEKYNRKQKTKK